jgi:hypothetical protein
MPESYANCKIGGGDFLVYTICLICRPPTGVDPLVGVSFPKETIAALDARAKAEKISRSEAIRRLVELGLRRQK